MERISAQYDEYSLSEFALNHSKDINGRGMFIETETLLPLSSEVAFELFLADKSLLLEGVGRVSSVQNGPRGSAFPSGVLIDFTELTERSVAQFKEIRQEASRAPREFSGIRIKECISLTPHRVVQEKSVSKLASPLSKDTQPHGEDDLLAAAKDVSAIEHHPGDVGPLTVPADSVESLQQRVRPSYGLYLSSFIILSLIGYGYYLLSLYSR